MSRTSVFLGALLLAVVALAPAAVRAQEDRTPSATVEIDQTQFALLFSGAFGGGTLHYQGRSYGFTIGGLGIGGIGIATLHATGEVYDLHDIADFGGVYGQAGASYALGKESAGRPVAREPQRRPPAPQGRARGHHSLDRRRRRDRQDGLGRNSISVAPNRYGRLRPVSVVRLKVWKVANVPHCGNYALPVLPWLEDDYGAGRRSIEFYGKIPEQQERMHQKTRDLVDKV